MSPIRMSKIEAAMRIVLEFREAFNRHDVAGMLKLISDDGVFESPGPAPDGSSYSGREDIALYWQDFFRAWPDSHMEIEEIYGFGDRCILRWRTTWVDKGGENRHIRGFDVFLVRDGFIREQLSYVKG